ncbi:hypothetical protein C8R46DRAFT_914571 [Mycena filopes]|nr:hypothetical protein C8R46DRAFT_914571 [Mycena filopes]
MYKTTSESVTGPYFIDDDDARIKYSGGWTRAGAEYDFLHTTHGSVGVGTSFSFTFEGKAVSFYGDINNNALASVSIALDNGLPVAYIAPTQPTTVTSNNAFFKSGTLAAGTHTLVVSTENANPFWLDYLLVTPNSSPDVSASASASIPASASNATTALPSFSVPTLPGIPNVTGPATSAITPSASAFGPGNASAPSAMPTGAAIGTTAPSAVLGLAALALCLFGGRLGR